MCTHVLCICVHTHRHFDVVIHSLSPRFPHGSNTAGSCVTRKSHKGIQKLEPGLHPCSESPSVTWELHTAITYILLWWKQPSTHHPILLSFKAFNKPHLLSDFPSPIWSISSKFSELPQWLWNGEEMWPVFCVHSVPYSSRGIFTHLISQGGKGLFASPMSHK